MTITQILSLIIIVIILNVLTNIYFPTRNSDLITIDKNQLDQAPPKPTPSYVKYFFISLSLIPLLAGLWGINTWFSEYNMAKDSVNWEKTRGKIVSKSTTSGLTSHLSTQGNVYSESTRAVCPEIEYYYKAQDKVYKSNKIDFSNRGCSTNVKDAEKILVSFPEVGDEVAVYLNEEKNITVLIPGAKDTNYLWLLLTSTFFLVGLILVRISFSS